MHALTRAMIIGIVIALMRASIPEITSRINSRLYWTCRSQYLQSVWVLDMYCYPYLL